MFLSRLGAAFSSFPRIRAAHYGAALIATATLLLFGTLAGCAPTSSNSSAPVCTPSAAGSATDCDGDGVANATDAFPTDACASLDSDADGQPDVLILPDDADDDACSTASSLTADAFPTDACATLDSDADGQPDTLILPADADDDACTTASALTADSEPSIPALLALDTTMAYTASPTGEHLFRLTIMNPVADAYKIGIMETGSGADDSAANVTALTATTSSAVNGRTDHTSRLRRGGLTPITNPIAADGSNVGVVYTFLPGDDATAATPAFSMLWDSYPTELAASLTYTIAVRAMAGTTYSLRVEKVTELSRLPSNIQTRARRGRCAEWLASSAAITANPIPISPTDDSVTCDEGGPAANGQGFYLLYNAGTAADQRRIRLDSYVADSTLVFFDTTPEDDAANTDDDGLADTTVFRYRLSQNCVSTGAERRFVPDQAEGTNRPLENPPSESEFSGQIYCVSLSGTADTSNIASNNLQFTLNPPGCSGGLPSCIDSR